VGRKIRTAYDAGKIVKVAAALSDAGNADIASRNTLSRTGSLVVREEKYPIPFDRAAARTAKLILVEGGASRIEVSSGVQGGVAEEFEGVAVKLPSPRLADDGDDTTVVVAVLGIEIIS